MQEKTMNPKRIINALPVFLCLIITAAVCAQDNPKAKNDPPPPRATAGKKLLTATDLLKVNAVAAPRIAPDGSRVAYQVGETRMEKDKEWKTTTQVWVVPTNGGKPRQYTRGD